MYLTTGGKYLSHNRMQYNYSTEMFTRRVKPIRITSVRISGVYCSRGSSNSSSGGAGKCKYRFSSLSSLQIIHLFMCITPTHYTRPVNLSRGAGNFRRISSAWGQHETHYTEEFNK